MNPSTLRRRIALAAVLAVAAGAASAQNWKPTRPINLIVPWAAGRLDRPGHARHRRRAREGARPDDRRRQPARRLGLDRHQERARRAKDGYTWTAGAAQDLGTYQTLGSLKTSITDWHLFLNVANIQVIGVNPKTPYKNAKQLLDAMKAKPGQISGRDRGRHLGRPQRDGADRQGDRRQVPPRHLRRRQPGGRRHRRRRGRRDDAARGRAGRHDPRQAPAAARRR